MDAADREYVKELHQPPLQMAHADEGLFTEYFKITMSGLLNNGKLADEVGWRVLSKNAADLAHEMVTAHKSKFKTIM